MEIDKKTIESLRNAKKTFEKLGISVQEAIVNVNNAISDAQKLCAHEFVQDEAHGYPDGSAYCIICGKFKDNENES